MASPSFYMSPLDMDFFDATAPNSQINNIEPLNNTQTEIIIPKTSNKKNNKTIIYIAIGIFIVLLFALFYYLFSSNNVSGLISKYTNLSKSSSFLNKDQIDFESELNFDKNYLLEQMIYKEFSPSEKKKYLNLPDILKEKLQIDFLINQI